MRTSLPLSSLIIACVVALAACGGGGGRTEQTFPLDRAPSAGAPDGLQAQVLHYKQRENYLIVNLRLVNNGKEAIVLKNPGSTMPGFSASAEGRTVSADKRGHATWTPWTGTIIREGTGGEDAIELAPGIATELELRWNWRPPLQRNEYPWAITIGQAFHGDAKLPDVRLSYPAK